MNRLRPVLRPLPVFENQIDAVNRIERGSVALGNGLLTQELSSNIDVALRGDSDKIEWELAIFLNDIDDYILLSPTPIFEEELQVFEYLQTEARLAGLEAEARIEILETTVGHLYTRIFADSDLYVFLRGKNLTDEDARQHTSPLKESFPLPGRSVQLGLRFDF